MALPPPNLPAVSRIVLHYRDTASGAIAVSVMHVLSSGATALDTFNRFSTSWQDNMFAYAPTTARMHTVDVTKLDNSTATESFSTVGVKFDGAQAGQCLPQVTLLVKYSTGFRGLASSGATYAPFVAEDVAANGSVDPTTYPTLVTAWTAFVNTLSTQTIPLQVVSYGREATPTLPAAPATNHTVTAVSISPILSTQRNRQSRLRG